MTDHYPDARPAALPWSPEPRTCTGCPRPVVWVRSTENRDDVRTGRWEHREWEK